MTRAKAIAYLRIAGYHNDLARWTRVYCENRIGIAAARKAWDFGVLQKERGVKCTCTTCNPTTPATK